MWSSKCGVWAPTSIDKKYNFKLEVINTKETKNIPYMNRIPRIKKFQGRFLQSVTAHGKSVAHSSVLITFVVHNLWKMKGRFQGDGLELCCL